MIYPPQSLRLISKAWSMHIDPNVQVTEEEARELFDMHAEVWEFTNWKTFCRGTLLQISKFSGVQSFHIGVVYGRHTVRMLAADLRKHPGQAFNEEKALEAPLRKEKFTQFLD